MMQCPKCGFLFQHWVRGGCPLCGFKPSLKSLSCTNCGYELSDKLSEQGARFHIGGTFSCPPFDDEGASISGTTAEPQTDAFNALKVTEGES
jgi:ribosomal protein L37E